MSRKKPLREKTGLFIACPCGSKAAIMETGWGYYGHCPNCGRLTFFRSNALLEKVRLGAKEVCPHQPELVECKGGRTSWCRKCRVRTFLPDSGG
jgi:hypothetical protein